MAYAGTEVLVDAVSNLNQQHLSQMNRLRLIGQWAAEAAVQLPVLLVMAMGTTVLPAAASQCTAQQHILAVTPRTICMAPVNKMTTGGAEADK